MKQQAPKKKSELFDDVPDVVKGLVNEKELMKNYTITEKMKHQFAYLTDLEYPKKFNHSEFVREAINEKFKTMTYIDWPESLDPNKGEVL